MPSSVLLALVVAAGVLVLMPALARRYDTALRGEAELQASSMRVLTRERRRRTIPAGGPLRPPTSALVAPAGLRTAHGVSPGGRDLAAVRASLVREVMRDAGPRTRVRVRRPGAGSATPTSAIPVSASPVSAAPAVVPVDTVRRVAGAQRAGRRRLLALLVLLVAGQAVAGFVLGFAFWVGAAVSAVVAVGLLGRLRVLAARRRHNEAQARRHDQLIARARQHRAEAFVRRALRQAPAGPDREAWLGPEAVRQAADWLALARIDRDRPARTIVRVLAAAGREVYLADGSWAVRPVPRPLPTTAPAHRRTTRVTAEAPLPKVVNG